MILSGKPFILEGKLTLSARFLGHWTQKFSEGFQRRLEALILFQGIAGCVSNCTKQKVTTGYEYQGCNSLHLSAIAAGVELPALLQLIHECC